MVAPRPPKWISRGCLLNRRRIKQGASTNLDRDWPLRPLIPAEFHGRVRGARNPRRRPRLAACARGDACRDGSARGLDQDRRPSVDSTNPSPFPLATAAFGCRVALFSFTRLLRVC